MAVVLAERHKLAAAAEQYAEVVRLTPDVAAPHFDLADVLREDGKTADAIEHYTIAVRLRPAFIEARNNLGLSLAEQGRLAEAEEQFVRALAVKPDFALAQFNLGRVLARQGRPAEAATHFARAIQLRPDKGEFNDGYAWFLATGVDPHQRDGARAVVLAEKACKLTHGRDARMVGTLAAAYAEAGRFTEAVDTSKRAIRVAHASEEETLIPDIEQRLKVFESGRPFHE
jgi:tetratricopeptide (TPR) repeat protein